MHSGIIRRFAAALLVLSVWGGALISLPASGFAQTKPKDAAKQDKKNKTEPKSTTPTPSGPAALGTKDDPSQIGKRNINKGTDKFFGWLGGSQEKEMQIGRQIALEVEQQSKLVEDPVVTEYVNRVGQNIVLHSDAKIPFTIKVIDSDEVNAFALPGGFFFVNKGLILAADNESELAGVMAHEIAHVAARHAMENQGKGTFMNYAALAGIIFGGPIVSSVLQNGGGILAGLASVKFSRGAETEADNLGVQYLYAAGYDPTGMSTMFEKLASQNRKKPGTISKLFSTHPQSVDRRDTSLQLVGRFPEKEEYVISTSEFQRVKSHLLKLTNAKAGVTTDFDQTDDSKPTLKKRQPDSTDPVGTDTGTGSSSSDGPPKLKKKDRPDPLPTPSPSPEM
ncbi:MAG: M48 family metallopeptidase [Pyrinomonadaceae bacterium]